MVFHDTGVFFWCFFCEILWKFNFMREIEWKNVIRWSRKRFFCKNEAHDELKWASKGSFERSKESRVWLCQPRVPQFQRPGRSLRIKDPWKSSPAGCKLQTVDWKQDARGLTRRWARRIDFSYFFMFFIIIIIIIIITSCYYFLQVIEPEGAKSGLATCRRRARCLLEFCLRVPHRFWSGSWWMCTNASDL